MIEGKCDNMSETYGLSRTEYEIMELLWQANKPLLFREIFEYFNERHNKNWKKQTLNTYLLSLRKMGMIKVSEQHPGYEYHPVYTKHEYVHLWTQDFVKRFFDGSISAFMAAFTGNKKVAKEDADELKKWLHDSNS